jgi:hypothetical protein
MKTGVFLVLKQMMFTTICIIFPVIWAITDYTLMEAGVADIRQLNDDFFLLQIESNIMGGECNMEQEYDIELRANYTFNDGITVKAYNLQRAIEKHNKETDNNEN